MFKRNRRSTQRRLIVSSLFTTGLAGIAAAGWFAHRYGIFPFKSRHRWASRSRKPQISRWQSEGGDVPQVRALRPRSTSRTRH